MSCLIKAAEKGHAECLSALIREGADVNHKDEYGTNSSNESN